MRVTHAARSALLACLLLAAGATGAAAQTVPIYLVRGDQLAVVSRTVPAGPTGGIATIDALLDGPTAAERAQGYRTAIPTHVGLDGYLRDPGRLVTVDVGPRFDGRSSAATRKARIAQLVYTATAISGVDRVRVRIDGATVASFAGIPLGGFVDRGVFLPRSSPTRPKYPPAPTSDFFKRVQLQLERTGYLPRGTANGLFGERTRQAVMAFQALEGLTVDGVVGTRTRARLPVAKRPVALVGPVTGRRLEVDTARHVLLLVGASGVVARAIHVSVGTTATPTPTGTFAISGQTPAFWSVPFQVWLQKASFFAPALSIHAVAHVPIEAATRGSVQVPFPEGDAVYGFARPGTPVVIR